MLSGGFAGKTPQSRPGEVPGQPSLKFPMVGVGASAGGLEAITQLLKHCPADADVAFLVVTHMDARQKSILPELLARATKMKVCEAEDGMAVEASTVYTAPATHDLIFENGKLRLLALETRNGIHLPIDTLFCSLAEELRERSICIILSGSGSDGSLGLKKIKATGGMTMAQSTESAEFDPMPANAIATHMVDFILPVEHIPLRLIEYTSRFWQSNKPNVTELSTSSSELVTLQRILSSIEAGIGHNFTHYKESTLHRCVAKRMVNCHAETLAAYADLLAEDTAEQDALFRSILIGVTYFFRDSEAFACIQKEVIPKLFAGKKAGDTIRIWVAGCSSGEEAYSLAILLTEHAERVKSKINIQIFATDLDPRTIEIARTAKYAIGAVQNVSPERLGRYFQLQDGCYVVLDEIRKLVVFAEHNILSDPPFHNVDLLSCRNLLIYLKSKVHTKLFSLFYHCLLPSGYLFLGSAESLGQSSKFFRIIEGKWKVFQRETMNNNSPPRLALLDRGIRKPMKIPFQEMDTESHLHFNELQKLLLDDYVPAAVLVDKKLDIIYYSGDTSPYLRHPKGAATQNLLKQAHPYLSVHLRSAIRQARENGQGVLVENIQAKGGAGAATNIRIKYEREDKSASSGLIVFFEKYQNVTNAATQSTAPQVATKQVNLEEELHITTVELQNTLAELDALTEESQTSYEELMSMNEELQSSNEELETSKEELHALNEELISANSELKSKVTDLKSAKDDISNLLTGTHLPTIVLNKNLEIRYFTPQSTEIFNLIASDLGRPIRHIVSKLVQDDLVDNFKSVLQSLTTLQREVCREDGSYYLMRIHPFITSANITNGVVLTFSDITDIKLNQAELQTHKEDLEQLVEQKTRALKASEALLRETGRMAKIGGWELDIETEQLNWTLQTHKIHDLEHASVLNLATAVGFYHPDDQPIIAGLVQECIQNGTSFDKELRVITAKGRNIWVRVMGELRLHNGQKYIGGTFQEITESKQYEIELEETRALAESANKAKSEFIANMSHEIRTPLNGIQGNLQLLGLSELDAEQNECVDMAMTSSDSLITIIGDILNLSKIEAGRVAIAADVFKIQSLLDSLASTLFSVAKNKGLHLNFEVDPSVPQEVTGDIGRIRQILFNLVGNAIKYTDQGSVTLRITIMERSKSPELRLSFSVTDTGIGIPEDSIPDLFEAFTQVDNSSSRSYQGTGLGLTIAKRLVELMGGSIDIQSKHGKGTTVNFDIVVKTPAATEIPKKEAVNHTEKTCATKDQKILNVLIVEDVDSNAIMLNHLLHKIGHKSTIAINGKQALECLTQSPYDLILMDIQMPGMDGFKATKIIRADPEFKHVAEIPIIALTAHVLDGYRERCLEAGMNDYLSKPVMIKDLERLLSSYL